MIMGNLTENDKVRYEMRDEIEAIIKENGIDREKFHEAGKDEYEKMIDILIPGKKTKQAYYLITDGGWVYEGMLAEIKKVLHKYPVTMDDFYLFPKDFGWLIMHCEDGACMCRVWKPA